MEPGPSLHEALPRTAAVLEDGIASGHHLGAQLHVSIRDTVTVDAALGQAREGVRMAPDTINVWFSSGKPVTAVAVAQLWEKGRLELDTPVAALLPAFATGGKDSILIRHLLNHTAGFRPADRVREPTWDETIRAICATPAEPDWIPGQRAGYQLFSSWFILGEIVRLVDGRSIDRYVTEEIFRPLGMSSCWMGLPASARTEHGARIGVMHFVSQGGLRPHPLWNDETIAAAVLPGGNVWGPIRELGRFYEALLTGESLLRRDTIEMFTKPARVGLSDETFQHIMDWGLGFAVNSNRYGPDTVPYGFGRYASDRAYGHGGSQSSCGFVDPERQLVVAWVCNGMIGEAAHQERARRINHALYEDLGCASVSFNAATQR